MVVSFFIHMCVCVSVCVRGGGGIYPGGGELLELGLPWPRGVTETRKRCLASSYPAPRLFLVFLFFFSTGGGGLR